MKIVSIASGSSGNCYMVSDGNTNLLIECGIPEKRIKEALWNENMRLSDISGCLVSHSHGDHVKSAQKLADMGVNIYTSSQTIDAAGLKGHRVKAIQQLIGMQIGSFYIHSFEVEHDAPGTLAFTASSGENRILYITDTMYFKYAINGITHLMIEANYDPECIAKNSFTGHVDPSRATRTINSHMSIESTLLTIKRMDKSKLREIWLLHLSNDNAADDFKKRVQEVSGVEVYIA